MQQNKKEDKVAELLKPRYKVIADWPDGARQNSLIGCIDTWTLDLHNPDVKKWSDYYEKYPHLFKKLEWWEDRKPEEMPLYISWRNKHIHMVERYGRSDINLHAVFTHQGRLRSKPVKFLLPATSQQYTDYIKSKK